MSRFLFITCHVSLTLESARPFGIGVGGFEPLPIYNFRQVVAKENIIRHLDHTPSAGLDYENPNNLPTGIRLVSVKKGVIEENIVDIDDPKPLAHRSSNDVKYFNNSTSSGALVPGYKDFTNKMEEELANQIEDATLMALI